MPEAFTRLSALRTALQSLPELFHSLWESASYAFLFVWVFVAPRGKAAATIVALSSPLAAYRQRVEQEPRPRARPTSTAGPRWSRRRCWGGSITAMRGGQRDRLPLGWDFPEGHGSSCHSRTHLSADSCSASVMLPPNQERHPARPNVDALCRVVDQHQGLRGAEIHDIHIRSAILRLHANGSAD